MTGRDVAGFMTGDTAQTGEERLPEAGRRLSSTRRRFLATSGVAVAAGATAGTLGDGTAPTARPPAEIVLRKPDLVTPPTGGYVADGAAVEDSRLLEHLETSVAGFRRATPGVSAFAATDDAAVPKYVESAVVALPPGLRPGVVAVRTGAWIEERYAGTTAIEAVDHETGPFVERWHSTTTEGYRDVLRLEHVGDGVLVFAVAYGRETADQTPTDAVERYATTMRDRAFTRD